MGYSGRSFTRTKEWPLGTHADVNLYQVFQKPGVRRRKSKPSRECQRLINARESVEKARRLILENFCEPGSLEIDLTFRRRVEKEEAVTAMQKYIRELRKRYRAAGAEFRYMYAKEQGEASGKWHFHLFVSPGPMSRDELEAAWPHGYANSRRPHIDETGLAGLAEYITKQRKNRGTKEKGKRSWSCSKNLRRPQPKIQDGKISMRELAQLAEAIQRRNAEPLIEKMWPGMTLVEAEAVRNLRNRGLYIRLKLAAPETWHNRRPVARYLSGEIGGAWTKQVDKII